MAENSEQLELPYEFDRLAFIGSTADERLIAFRTAERWKNPELVAYVGSALADALILLEDHNVTVVCTGGMVHLPEYRAVVPLNPAGSKKQRTLHGNLIRVLGSGETIKRHRLFEAHVGIDLTLEEPATNSERGARYLLGLEDLVHVKKNDDES